MYESRIYVFNRVEIIKPGTDQVVDIVGNQLAVIDLAAAGGIEHLFHTPIDFDVYHSDGDTAIKADCYGDTLKSAPIQTVIDWLEEMVKHDSYRRYPPILAFLKALDPKLWDDLVCVHYGY